MNIGGLNSFTLSDFPGKVSAILFTQGCNFRCPFCHNGSLLPLTTSHLLSEEYIFEFLSSRKNKLEGVVITGGEPTIHNDLDTFIKKIRSLNLSIKLDTNGSNPEVLQHLINENLLDYIAMDIKAPIEKYNILSGVNVCIKNIQKSIQIISSSNVKHEFRTTYVPHLLKKTDIKEIQKMVPLNKHRLQKFQPENAYDPALKT